MKVNAATLTALDPADGTDDTEVDRRYLQLQAALVDATRLDQLPKAEPLIEHVLTRDSINWLHGKPGHAKSFVALDWACCVATGRPYWQGYRVTEGPVLYVLAEGAHGMHQRRQAWEITNGTTVEPGRLIFLPVAVQMMTALDTAAVAMLAKELCVALVVIDTQARVTVGADENSSRDMGVYVAGIDRVRQESGACVLTVHHEARAGESLRGSTALEGAATTIIRATKDGSIVRLDNTKQKDGPPFDLVIGRLETVVLAGGGTSAAWSHDPVGLLDVTSESESHIIGTLRDSFGTTGASSTNLRDATGLPKSTYFRALNSLMTKGIVLNTGTKTKTCYVLAATEATL